jgi:hypothetical protein
LEVLEGGFMLEIEVSGGRALNSKLDEVRQDADCRRDGVSFDV